MGLTRASLDQLYGATNSGNATPIHLWINQGHGNASDSNLGTDPNYPLATWIAAAEKLPTRSRGAGSIFWHTGPGTYVPPHIKGVNLSDANIYVVGDGAGTFGNGSSHTVLFTGTVDTVLGKELFTVLGGGLGTVRGYDGKSLRWLTSTNGNAGPEFTGQMRMITKHSNTEIQLSSQVEFVITPGDTFEIFVPTVFLDQPLFGPELQFENIGSQWYLEQRGEETIPVNALSPDQRVGGGLFFINIGLTQSDNSGAPGLGGKSASIGMFGVQNSLGVGQGPGSGAAPFVFGGTACTIQAGFEGYTSDLFGAFLGTSRITTDFGLSSELAWRGWGLGIVAQDPAAYPFYPIHVVSDVALSGYIYAGGLLVISTKLQLHGNSNINSIGTLLSVGLFAFSSECFFYRLEDGIGEMHIGGVGDGTTGTLSVLAIDCSIFCYGNSYGRIFFEGVFSAALSKVLFASLAGDLLFRNNDFPGVGISTMGLSGSLINGATTPVVFKPATTYPGTIDLVASYPGAGALDTLTLNLKVDGGATQTVTFVTPPDAGEALSQIQAQTTGITASLNLSTNGTANGLLISSDTIPETGSIEIEAGTANGVLGLILQTQNTTDGAFSWLSAILTTETAILLDSAEIQEDGVFTNTWNGDVPWNSVRGSA